jgi:hypothetical protein
MFNYFNGNNNSQNQIPDLDLSSRIQGILPAVREILRKLKKESSEMINVAETYDTYLQSKINKSNDTNEQLLKMLKNPFGKNGKIITAKSNTDMILNFSELIQFETADIMKNILDLVDLSYDTLLKEVAKTEGQFEDRKFRFFLKTSYIPREEHEEILSNMHQELSSSLNLQSKKQLREIEFLNEDLKKENLRIKKLLDEKNEELNRISLNLSLSERKTQIPNQEINNSLLEKDSIINDLQFKLANQEKEIKRLREMQKEKDEKIYSLNSYENELKNLKALNQSLNVKLQENNNSSFDKKKFEDLKTRIHELELELIQTKKDSEFYYSQKNSNLELLENKYKKEILNLEEENHQLKNLNMKLRKDDSINQSELKNKLLFTENEDHKKEISELQNKLKLIGDKYNQDLKNESEKLNFFYENEIIKFKQNLENEKNYSKNALSERCEINYKYLQAVSQLEEMKNNDNLMKDQYDHTTQLLKSQINDLVESNEKLEDQFDKERKKLEELSDENSSLRKQIALNEISINELKTQVKKFENMNSNDFKSPDNQLSSNDLKNIYDKKIQLLEEEKKDLVNKLNQKSSFYDNELKKLSQNDSMTSEKRQKYEERISELEHTVFELRSKINEEELENENHVKQNENFKLAYGKLKDEISVLKNQQNLFESQNRQNNETIKELNTTIQSLENDNRLLKSKLRENENQNLNLSNQKSNENFDESNFIINELKHINESLIHEMAILKSDKESEKKIMEKALNEKKELIDNLVNNRDKTIKQMDEERNKDKQNILKLEKEIRNLKVIPLSENKETLRINELEYFLLEERNKNETYEKELVNANIRIKEFIDAYEEKKNELIKLEGQLIDHKGFKKQLDFENEIFRKQLESKESLINNLIEEQKSTKYRDDKNISELNTKIKELNRRIEDLELEKPEEIVCAENPEDEDLYNQLIELRKENVDHLAVINSYESELFSYLDKIKQLKNENDSQREHISKLWHENEELNMNKEEMKLYQDLYNEIKSEYETKSAELELMKIKLANQNEKPEINLETYKNLKKKNEILEDENRIKEQRLQESLNEIEQLKNQINLNKNAIQENLNYRNTITNVTDRPNILMNTNKARNPNVFYEEVKKSNYYLMDFETNDYTGLLINKENWHYYLKNWLMPLRENKGENLKINLLYKAMYHGFGQNEFKNRAK